MQHAHAHSAIAMPTPQATSSPAAAPPRQTGGGPACEASASRHGQLQQAPAGSRRHPRLLGRLELLLELQQPIHSRLAGGGQLLVLLGGSGGGLGLLHCGALRLQLLPQRRHLLRAHLRGRSAGRAWAGRAPPAGLRAGKRRQRCSSRRAGGAGAQRTCGSRLRLFTSLSSVVTCGGRGAGAAG